MGVLRGLNSASYKLALAKSLLDLGAQKLEVVTLEDLAVPFSREICVHLASVDAHGTFQGGRFLNACRYHNRARERR